MIIDGKKLAGEMQIRLKEDVALFIKEQGIAPCVAVIQVGDNPSSKLYVNNKQKACADVGMISIRYHLPSHISETELLTLIQYLNDDTSVHGILLQLPLPEHLSATRAIAAIHPSKDVDGLHPHNLGLLLAGTPVLVPCTPQGCLMLIRTLIPDITGLHAVVIGRSLLVGKPAAALLLEAGATVTIVHSKTVNIQELCRQGDILVAAAGRPRLVKKEWVKKGAVVIDVGVTRVIHPDGRQDIQGDVDFEEVASLARGITPVPGGVGPMTIACLLKNVLQAARKAVA